ncbi:Chromatin organization modifier domain [Teratosphaeria destructans]|uniref:Chromatin organization modifier domain n=1 Tax=Teratosphaeria destructans TaxID=418781 RepID=A0A9W7T0X2_9PEZI|nr:Chromatin organization modifier domain [Teratosphaeria destructans]
MSRPGNLFEEDSDYDSVATETQESSDEEGDYNVEELLAEKISSEDGMKYYLVNWQGYPDYRMTWEPEEHVASEVLIQQWQERKKLIAQGKVQAFDVDAWEARKDKWRAERDDRARRRKIKLRKRRMRQGLPVSTSAADGEPGGGKSRDSRRSRGKALDSGDEDVIMGGTSPKKRVKPPAVKPRKGIAQRLNVSRRRVIEESDDDDSEHLSLFEEETQHGLPHLADEQRPPAAPEESKTPRPPTHTAPRDTVVQSGQQTGPDPQKKVGPGLMKTGRPTVNADQPTAKKSKKNVLGPNPFAPRASYRQQTLREKPKDQQGAHFRNLSQMSRMNAYDRTEPRPDINQLTFVDISKGDSVANQVKPSSTTSTVIPKAPREIEITAPTRLSKAPPAIHSAYSRRTPPPEPQGRSSSPLTRPPSVDPRRRKTEVCFYWLDGTCSYTEETCNFAHHAIDHAATTPQFQPQQEQEQGQGSMQGAGPGQPAQGSTSAWHGQDMTTCFYWQRDGECNRGNHCSFAHADAGVYSKKWHLLSETEKAKLRDRKPRNDHNKDEHHPGQAPGKRKTCSFWQNGSCRYSAEECKFAHYDTSGDVPIAMGERLTSSNDAQSPADVSLRVHQMQGRRMSIGGPGSPALESARSSSNTGTPICSPLLQLDGAGSRLQHDQVFDASDTACRDSAQGLVDHDLLNLDMNYLFEGVHKPPPGQNVFILWPSNRHAELQKLQQRFLDVGCKVHSSGIPAAWDNFRTKHYKLSLVLVHREMQLWRVPGLNEFLQIASGHVQFFRVDTPDTRVVAGAEDDELGQTPGYTYQRIFPDGRITYITDDVFIYHPQKALAIIQDVLKRGKGRNAKIATRPGIKDWLCKPALDDIAGRGTQQSPEYMHLYQAICDLCPPEDEDPLDPPNPLPSSTLVSASVDELPSFVEMWDSQPRKATSYMVEWFAGWCLMNVEKFRRFVVCHEPKAGGDDGDVERWRKEFQHIGVMTPEQVLEQVRKK